MKIHDVMSSDPAYCVPTDTAQAAARIMKEKNTGIVPIVENGRKLIGVVTDRDLCLDIIAEGRDPRSVKVQECMTSNVISCTPDDDVNRASELMRENLVRRIPVVDAHNTIQGMVSMADLLRREKTQTKKTHETLKKISEPSSVPSKPRAESRRRSAA